MSNTKHTPGPWYYESGEVVGDPNDTEHTVIAMAHRESSNKYRPTERDANMRLCSVAPELLAVCKAARDGMSLTGESAMTDGERDTVIRLLSLAIEKAEGSK
jgi:hypothetical protein